MSDKMKEAWDFMVSKAAGAKGITYEQVVADLEAGRAVLEIKFVIDPNGRIKKEAK